MAGLVLDSTLGPNGTDADVTAPIAAIPAMYDDLCSNGACAHIAADPVADLAELAGRLRTAPLTATLYEGAGKPFTVTITRAACCR